MKLNIRTYCFSDVVLEVAILEDLISILATKAPMFNPARNWLR